MNFVLRIDFPALDALVAYLIQRDGLQAKIDAATTRIESLTARLQTTNAATAAAETGART